MSEKHLRTSRLPISPRNLSGGPYSPSYGECGIGIQPTLKHLRSRGFSLLEIMIVAAIGTIMVAIGLPIINTTMASMHLTSASASLAGALQSARYQAISTGCMVQVSVSATASSFTTPTAANANLLPCGTGIACYQVITYPLSTATPPSCSATATYGSIIPFTPLDTVFSSTAQTLQFNASGTVTESGSSAPFALVLTPLKGGQTNTVNVSGVGYVKVTAP
jgi:prepilin-type N-terminal cleavage/methylation domain-containing protein